MTIINRTHGFIFIHVPKTCGTSLTEHLRCYGGPDELYVLRQAEVDSARSRGDGIKKHSSARQICEALGAAAFNRLFKLSVVRNPFTHAVSIFRYLKYNFHAWPKAPVMENINTLAEFVDARIFRTPGPGGIIRPQVDWLCDPVGKPCIDLIARLETLAADLRTFRPCIGLPGPDMPPKRRSMSTGHTESLTAALDRGATVDAIRARYAEDFALLRYSMDPQDAIGEAALESSGCS